MAKLGEIIDLGAGWSAEITTVAANGHICSYKLKHPSKPSEAVAESAARTELVTKDLK